MHNPFLKRDRHANNNKTSQYLRLFHRGNVITGGESAPIAIIIFTNRNKSHRWNDQSLSGASLLEAVAVNFYLICHVETTELAGGRLWSPNPPSEPACLSTFRKLTLRAARHVRATRVAKSNFIVCTLRKTGITRI